MSNHHDEVVVRRVTTLPWDTIPFSWFMNRAVQILVLVLIFGTLVLVNFSSVEGFLQGANNGAQLTGIDQLIHENQCLPTDKHSSPVCKALEGVNYLTGYVKGVQKQGQASSNTVAILFTDLASLRQCIVTKNCPNVTVPSP